MSLDVWLKNQECPTCGRGDEIFDANITHNLTTMADAAGVYEACWRPEDCANCAGDLIPLLRAGVEAMRADPEKFRAFNAPNGWGTYDHFLPWLERYLKACEDNPTASIHVSR